MIALVGMLALAVAVPIVAIVDLFGNRGPLFYSQPRVGKDGVVFTIHKFRTMRPGGSLLELDGSRRPAARQGRPDASASPRRRASTDVERPSPRPVDRGA